MLYSFFSKPEYYCAFVKEQKYQSKTTAVFEINRDSEALRKFAAEKGLILGAGYKQSLPGGKDFKNQHLQIGNFPALLERDIKKLIQVLKSFNFSEPAGAED